MRKHTDKQQIREAHAVPQAAGRVTEKQRRKPSAGRRAAKVFARTGAGLLIIVLTIAALFFGALTMIHKGPYPRTKALFVSTVMETSALKFMARMYMSEDEIAEMLKKNSVDNFEGETTDPGDIEIPDDVADDEKDLEIIEIKGATYRGKLMIVKDPSRIAVATIPKFGEGMGLRTHEIIIAHDAVAGINAGGFLDYGGKGDGGTPDGIIIQNGKLVYGSMSRTYDLIGFDDRHVLILGKMTGKQALERNVQEAVSFGPFLIINGEPGHSLGSGGGLNPRTAIGQRKDGAVLLLVVDGRQPSSLGALYTDLIDIMLEYGAYNAANLDGGSSTVMVYEDQIINTCVSLYGPRRTPSAIIVKEKGE